MSKKIAFVISRFDPLPYCCDRAICCCSDSAGYATREKEEDGKRKKKKTKKKIAEGTHRALLPPYCFTTTTRTPAHRTLFTSAEREGMERHPKRNEYFPLHQKRQKTGDHHGDECKDQSLQLVPLKDARLDASLTKSVLLQNYVDKYGKCIFFIAPVFLQSLDTNLTRALSNADEYYHSESDDIILFNFYIAVALG